MSRAELNTLIDSGDYAALIKITLNANAKAAEGVFCQCAEPDVVGLDLMCGECYLEVESQREGRQRALREPHAYVVGRHDDIGMCDFCTRWKDDPIHVKEATR